MSRNIPFSSGGGFEIGEVVETAETTKGGITLLPLDGKTYLNSAYPELSALLLAHDFSSWQSTNITQLQYKSVDADGNNVIAVSSATPSTIGEAPRYSTDGGISWNSAPPITTASNRIYHLACASGSNLAYIGAASGGASTRRHQGLYSTDNGSSWALTSGYPLQTNDAVPLDMCMDGNNGYVLSPNGDRRTTDAFQTVTAPSTAPSSDCLVCDISGSIVVVGGYSAFLAFSSDGGDTFANTGTNPLNSSANITAIAIDGTTVYVTNTLGQIAKSTDGGSTYTLLTQSIFTTSNQIVDLDVKGTTLYAFTSSTLYIIASDNFVTADSTSTTSSTLTIVAKGVIAGTSASGLAFAAGTDSVTRSVKNPTSFTLPNRAGAGEIRDKIGAKV